MKSPKDTFLKRHPHGPNWLLQNSHGDVKYSIGDDIPITVYGVGWVWDLPG